ncbi:glycosyl hydrolase family 61-domain-containing protein [Leptodontidium sp. 2 PMI_412]|nr:glycosyl hydrolase family 61-domain-containing protein [Leptodontidium sp. 2 PMI_412]
MSFATFSLLAALAATTVSAHGYVNNASIGGVEYTGYQPYQDPYTTPLPDRIFRAIQGNGPVEDLTSIDIQCGGYTAGGIVGSSPAKLTAGPVAAGSQVDLYWTLWPESHMGPAITYMALCPGGDCSTFVPESDAVWFKVQEAGRTGSSDVWASDVIEKAGGFLSYTIPSCLAPGSYLVRHEVIALHAAYAYPGAQFYPSCHQIEVTGSGSTTPSALVSFPGAYAAADPGITYDAYKASEYTIPGPALFTCGGSADSGSAAPIVSSSASAPVATSVVSNSTLPAITTSAAPLETAAPVPTVLPSTLQTLVQTSSTVPVASAAPVAAAGDC